MAERLLQGPIINNNDVFLFEEMSSERLNPWPASTSSSSHEASCCTDLVPGFNPNMPFLRLLQSAVQGARTDATQKEPIFSPSPLEPNLHLLLRLQNEHSSSLKASMESCIKLCSDLHEKSSAPLPAMAGPCVVKRRRKRTRVSQGKKPEETECQRITHINIERNRRKLMNEHLATLKSLIPSSLVPRGDQASIIGGAIDYVKELEQVLLYLQSKKKAKTSEKPSLDEFLISPQYTGVKRELEGEESVDVEAKVVQGHVNLKVAGNREDRTRRLVYVISALEEWRLTVLHLTVTTVDHRCVIYCFNLKMEEDCRLLTADEIAGAVQQIFCY
ncbi:hypothetical protein LUZ60_014602 [Juncus effusus]|nr:hypothetical protein LUZ60_014602 [Juncus effusus]